MNRWLVVLDLDRTLTNEDMVVDTLAQACRTVGIDPERFRAAKTAINARGESFSELHFLQSEYPPELVDRLQRSFLELAKPESLLYPDVQPLINALTEQNVPFLILTYGPPEWQRLKLSAAGLDGYHTLITETMNKGVLMQQWRHGAGYLPPGWNREDAAGGVLLVDDKAVSFSDLPPDCRGAWLRRPDEVLQPSQAGTVPAHVTTISSLTDCLDLLDDGA